MPEVTQPLCSRSHRCLPWDTGIPLIVATDLTGGRVKSTPVDGVQGQK